MVDVGLKTISRRTAVAEGEIVLGEKAWRLVAENNMKKGDVLTVSQLAGVMAVKQTSNLMNKTMMKIKSIPILDSYDYTIPRLTQG